MKAIVLFLALVSGALADEYQPVDWLFITEDFGIGIQQGGLFLTFGGCGGAGTYGAGGKDYQFKNFKWQHNATNKGYRSGEITSSWKDIPGSGRSSGVCAFDADYIEEMGPGLYRFALDVSIDGVVRKYASGNAIWVEGEIEEEAEEAEDETAVETVSWGFLKSRATR